MRKIVFASVVILMLSLLTMLHVVEVVDANAFPEGGFFIRVPAPDSVNLISKISSPIEDASYSNGTINLCFDVTVDSPDSVSMQLRNTVYQGDWMQKNAWFPYPTDASPHFLQYNLTLTDIPVGEHTLNITLCAEGYYTKNSDYPHYVFTFNRVVSVNFSMSSGTTTTDTTSSVPFPTAYPTSLPPTQSASPSLPSNGVFALDFALVVIGVIGISAVASAGLLVYFRRRKK
jgi:hypothetical protein